MRKLSLLLVLIFCASMSFAQKGKVTQANSYLTSGKLDQAKKLIDMAIQHKKCVTYAKAYFVKGQIYQAIAESQIEIYKKLDSDPLTKAWDAFQEVIKLDEKKHFTKKLKPQYKNLIIDYTNKAIEYYNAEKFAEAVGAFEKVLALENNDIVTEGQAATVDTMVIYNTAIAAQRASMYDVAEKYCRETLKLNYEPAKTYAILSNVLKTKGDREGALKVLQEGFEKYPENEYMLIELINYYLLGSEPEKAEQYLDAAIKQNPENASYYEAKGSLYDKINEPEKAEAMYRKTLELKPDDFVAQYSLGNIELNKVNDLLKKVQDIQDIKKYNAGLETVYTEFAKVIPYFEKARKLRPKDKNSLIILKELYFRLRDKDAKYMTKYKEVIETLKSL